MGTFQKIVLTALAVPVVLAIVSCGGGGEADDTSREITSEQLAQMVLALEQFGPEYAGFAPDEDNGLLNLEQAAEEEDDVDAERADLQQFGFSSAHKSFFSNPTFPGTGLFSVGGILYLFETKEGAEGYFADSVNEIADERGDAELSFDKFETFEMDVGDEGVGGRIEGQVQKDDGTTVPFWGSLAYLRRGRLIGGLVTFGFQVDEGEQTRLEGKIATLASVMNERIASVLAATAPTGAPAAAGQ